MIICISLFVTEFRKVLKKQNVMSLHALENFNVILVHSDEGIEAYAIDIMAGVVLGTSRPQDLDASHEQVSGSEVAVSFVRVGKANGRTMGEWHQVTRATSNSVF